MWETGTNKVYFRNWIFAIATTALLAFAINPGEQRLAQAKGAFYLEKDDSGGVKPHYFGIESERSVPMKQQMGDSSAEDEGRLVTVNGQIRIHHHLGFVNLARKPDDLKSFRTSSHWTAIESVDGSYSRWKIKADEGSVLEVLVNIDNPMEKQYKPLYLAPGFEGKIHLARGESTLVFGKKYTADNPQELVVTWDGVKVITARTNILIIYCIVIGIVAVAGSFLVVLIQRKKRLSSTTT